MELYIRPSPLGARIEQQPRLGSRPVVDMVEVLANEQNPNHSLPLISGKHASSTKSTEMLVRQRRAVSLGHFGQYGPN
jgi:hypothetical protein